MIASCAHPTLYPFSTSLQVNSKSSVKQVAPHPNSLSISVFIQKPVPPNWLDNPIFALANWNILLDNQKDIE
ncbi:hypothetical protein D3C73_1169800 [compost metagenome]